MARSSTLSIVQSPLTCSTVLNETRAPVLLLESRDGREHAEDRRVRAVRACVDHSVWPHTRSMSSLRCIGKKDRDAVSRAIEELKLVFESGCRLVSLARVYDRARFEIPHRTQGIYVGTLSIVRILDWKRPRRESTKRSILKKSPGAQSLYLRPIWSVTPERRRSRSADRPPARVEPPANSAEF